MNDSLAVRASVGTLDTEIGRFTHPYGAGSEGNEFGRSPSYMLGLGADWDINRWVSLSADLSHVDGYHSSDQNAPAYQVRAYTLANARVTFKPTNSIELVAYANNLFDERSATFKYDDRTAGGIVAAITAPREVGVGLRARY